MRNRRLHANAHQTFGVIDRPPEVGTIRSTQQGFDYLPTTGKTNRDKLPAPV
jgi:hypothetical protein